MSQPLRAFKKFNTAKTHAKGAPVLRVGDLFLVGVGEMTSIDLIAPSGNIVGTVSLRHLNRLGNANHASGGLPMGDAFPEQRQ